MHKAHHIQCLLHLSLLRTILQLTKILQQETITGCIFSTQSQSLINMSKKGLKSHKSDRDQPISLSRLPALKSAEICMKTEV